MYHNNNNPHLTSNRRSWTSSSSSPKRLPISFNYDDLLEDDDEEETKGKGQIIVFSTQWFEQLWSRLKLEFTKRSTFQIIVIAILLHSAASIALIYAHLNYYSETYLSKHTTSHAHPNKGQIAIYSKTLSPDDVDSELRYKLGRIDYKDEAIFGPNSVNLLSSALINSKSLSYIGWFSDHYRWEEKVQCFNNRWTLCDKIYTAKCKQDTIRAIYQFVPFKSSASIHQLFFSLRASAEQLVEQSAEAFYGMLALVQFSDGTDEVLRLKFQYESDAWSLRTLNFETPKSISSVTVMLACFGYTGVASFTDVRLSTRTAGRDPLFSSLQVASWCDYLTVNQTAVDTTLETEDINSSSSPLNYEILPLPHSTSKSASKSTKSSLVTFVSQVSMDRLTVLERSLQTWTGPVSLAIYVPVKSSTDGILDWQRLYINKKMSALSISPADSSILLVPAPESDQYPINRLRNLAIRMVRTRFMFLVDADFQPSPGLEVNFASTLHRHHHELYKDRVTSEDKKRIAFVVPAFEYLETPNKNDPILRSKDELIQLVHRDDPLIQPFRFFESNEAHCLTNYWKWYYTTEPYYIETRFHDKYEPYIIVEKTPTLPLYHESLTNYGMNKVMHISELFAAGYRLQVLDTVWAIHFPHRATPYYAEFLQHLEQRLRNRAARFGVLAEILRRYRVQLQECSSGGTSV